MSSRLYAKRRRFESIILPKKMENNTNLLFFLCKKLRLLDICANFASKYNVVMSKQILDKLDRQILKLISQDARIPFLEVARACNVSGAAIHQRVAKLTNLGIIKGSQFIIDPEKIGYETCAYMGLYLKDPENFDHVVEELKKIPEVVECHYTTGGFDMFIKIYALNNHHLLQIIHDKLQPLGLSRSETIISFNAAINRQLSMKDIEELDDEEEMTEV